MALLPISALHSYAGQASNNYRNSQLHALSVAAGGVIEQRIDTISIEAFIWKTFDVYRDSTRVVHHVD